MKGVATALAWLLCAASAAAQGNAVDVNTGGRITVNADGTLDINVGDLTLGGTGRVDLTAGTADLDVARDVDINAGATLEVTGGATAAELRVGRNWENDGTWTPGGSTVYLNGTGAQTIERDSAADATENFNHLTVVNTGGGTVTTAFTTNGDQLSLTGNLVLDATNTGTLDLDPTANAIVHAVGGDFTHDGGTLEIDGSATRLDVAGDYSMTAGSTSFINGSEISVEGNASITGGTFAPPTDSLFKMDGDAAATGNLQTIAMTAAGATFGTLQAYNDDSAVAKSVQLLTAVSTRKLKVGFAGGVQLGNTTFDVNGQTIAVSSTANASPVVQVVGNSATALGILLMDDAAGVVDCAGRFEINARGQVTMSLGEIRVERDWEETAASAVFQPTGGTVVFDGGLDSQIDGVQAANSFFNLRLNKSVGTATLEFGPGIAGTASTIEIADLGSVDVDGGTLRLRGVAGGALATITATGATTFSFDLAGGTTFDADWYQITGLNADGVQIHSGTVLAGVDNGTFNSVAASGFYWNFNPAAAPPTLSDRNNIPVSFNNMTFNAGGAGGRAVKARWATPDILVTGGGALFGEAYDDEGAGETAASNMGRIRWDAAPVRRLTGAPTNYASLERALAATALGDASDDRFRFLTRWPVNIQAMAIGGSDNVYVENGVFWPRTGQAFDNAGAGEAPGADRGVFRNCIFAKGGADNIGAENCTFFDPDTGAASNRLTYSAITNCLVEAGSNTDGTAPGVASNLAAGTALFVNAAMMDFHLVANNNLGLDLSGSWPDDADFEFQARPVGAAWDQGADEFVANTPGDIAPLPDAEGASNLGDITDLWMLFRNGARYSYVVNRGGSTGGLRDNMLVLMERNPVGGVMREVATFNAGYPIMGMTYAVVDSAGVNTEVRILLLVDTDSDGYADGVMAVIDTLNPQHAGFPAPAAWPLTFTAAASNINPVDNPAAMPQNDANKANWYRGSDWSGLGPNAYGSIYADYFFQAGAVSGVRRIPAGGGGRMAHVVYHGITSDGADPQPPGTPDRRRWHKRLFTISNGVLYKINADPSDGTDNPAENEQYGEEIWQYTTHQFEWRGPMWTQSNMPEELWVPVSNDASNLSCVKVDWNGYADNGNPVVGWTVDGTSSNDESRYGVEMKLGGLPGGENTFVFMAASDGNKVASVRTNMAAGSKYWTTGALSGTITAAPVRPLPVAKKYLFVGAGDRIEKIADNSSLPDNDPLNGVQAWAPGASDGDATTGYGNITSNLTYITDGETRLFWGTERGFAASFQVNLDSTPGGGAERFDTGFPYAMANDEVNQVLMSFEIPGGWSVLFVSRNGRVLKFYTQ